MMEGAVGAIRGQALSGYGGVVEQGVPPRDPEIVAQLQQLHAAIERLQSQGSELCDRLVPVSQATPPLGAEGKVAVPHQVLCPIADQIRTAREQIDCVGQLLNTARNRLEI